MYRAQPDTWAFHKLGFEPAPYRSREALEAFLAEHPNHLWAAAAFRQNALHLDHTASYQRDALRMMANPGRYILRWPNGIGKTATLAILLLWFLDCYPDGAAVTTAGTWSQIRDQLWREVPHWAARARPGALTVAANQIMKTGVTVADKWFAIGRAASKEATFEGLHSPNVLVIFDEAKAIKQEIWDAAMRILRGQGLHRSRLWWVVASTPGSPFGPYYEACAGQAGSRWEQHKISAYESQIIALDEIERDLKELGPDGPLFWSMDLAEFPVEGEDTVLPLSVVMAAVEGSEHAEEAQKASKGLDPFVGCDVARYGPDETCAVVSQGGWAKHLDAWKGKSLTESAGRLHALLTEWGVQPGAVALDDTGLGGGVVDMLAEKHWAPIAINNGSPAMMDERFTNWITEAWFAYRDLLREHLVSIPDDRILINQLASRRYEFVSDGRLRLESKDKMRAEGRPSPDRAEAVIYSAVGGMLQNATVQDQFHLPSSEHMGEFQL